MTAIDFTDRHTYIGASEVACLLGQSPWGTPLSVWAEKTGRMERPEETDLTRSGHHFEFPIAQHFAKEFEVEVIPDQRVLVHPDLPCLRGHCDFRIVDRDDAIVEVKAVSHPQPGQWGDAGTDHIPVHYWIQVQVYMELSDADICYVVAGFRWDDIRTYPIKRDRDAAAAMVEEVRQFWATHIEADYAPEPSDTSEFRFLHPTAFDDALTIGVDDERSDSVLEHWRTYLQAHQDEKAAKKAKEQSKFELVKVMQDAPMLIHSGERQTLCTFQNNKRGTRTFSIKEPK